MHSVPRCLDNQGEKLQGVGLSGARVGESLPRLARGQTGVTISPPGACFSGTHKAPNGTGANIDAKFPQTFFLIQKQMFGARKMVLKSLLELALQKIIHGFGGSATWAGPCTPGLRVSRGCGRDRP